MKTIKRPQLNFASHPQRNTKFFNLLFVLLLSLLLIILAGSAWSFFKYRNKAIKASSSIGSLEAEIQKIKEDEKKLEFLVAEEQSLKQSQIDLINSIIYKKSFSWIGFLTHLEDLLPGSCYVLSLDPVLNNGKKVSVNLRVASPSLNDLLEFVSRLDSQGFSEIRVNNETTLEDGYLAWGLSYSYEKTI